MVVRILFLGCVNGKEKKKKRRKKKKCYIFPLGLHHKHELLTTFVGCLNHPTLQRKQPKKKKKKKKKKEKDIISLLPMYSRY